MENTDKVIDRIRKLFALSNHNTNEEEAKNAALKAQSLLKRYHISSADLEEVKKEIINSTTYEVGSGNKWKMRLGDIIARNFRCKCFWYGRTTVAFYGYDSDRDIALETFLYLYRVGHNLGKRVESNYRKEHGYARGVFNAFIVGFCDGIANVLDKQCTALMLITPSEVEESFKEMSKDFRSLNNTLRINSDDDIYNDGYIKGQAAMSRNALEGTV